VVELIISGGQTCPGIHKIVLKAMAYTFVDMGLLIDGDMTKTSMTLAGVLSL
jgi:hypothetical protein